MGALASQVTDLGAMQFAFDQALSGWKKYGIPWIWVTPEPRKEYPLDCQCQTVYRVQHESIKQFIERGWNKHKPGTHECVCACYGRVIE